MSASGEIDKSISLAFGKLLNTCSEALEGLSNAGLVAEISCDVCKGSFTVNVARVVPLAIAEELEGMKAKISVLELKLVPQDEPEEVPGEVEGAGEDEDGEIEEGATDGEIVDSGST